MLRKIVFMLIAFLLPAAVQAAPIEVKVNHDNGEIAVSGILGNEYAGSFVSLLVYRTDEGAVESTLGVQGTAKSVALMDQVAADAKGEYLFAAQKLLGESGFFTVRVVPDKYYENPNELIKNMFVPTTEAIEHFMKLYRSAKNEDETALIIQKSIDSQEYDGINLNVGLDGEFYNNLGDFGKKTLASKLFSNANRSTVTFSEFEQLFLKESIVCSFLEVTDANQLDFYINPSANSQYFEQIKSAVKFDTELSVYKKFADLPESEKNQIIAAAAKKNVTDIDSWINEWKIAAVNAELSKLYAADVQNWLTESRDVLTYFDYSAYQTANKYYNEIAADILNHSDFDSVTSLCTYINSRVDYYNSLSDGGAYGRGGGGKGGLGVSGKYSVELPEKSDSANQPGVNKSFSDLTDVPWAVREIEGLSAMGIINGFDDGTFRPNDLVTREQFTKMIVAALNVNTDGYDCDFLDVSKDKYYYKYIAYAFNNGYIKGMQDNKFGVGESITRQDAVVIASRIFNLEDKNTDTEIKFSDWSDISDYAGEAVRKMTKIGIINGVGDGRFAPYEGCTRAQAARIIYNLLNYGGNIK